MTASKLLLIFDLNGTLLDRISSSDSVRMKAWRTAASLHLAPLHEDFSAAKRKVFLRPHINHFLSKLLEHDQIAVATWTSAMERTAGPIVHRVFGDGREKTAFHWYRDRCTVPNPRQFKVSFKDLSQVWQHFDGCWSERNTILVDNSSAKAEFQPRNLLCIPTFDVGQCGEPYPKDDRVLLELLDYADRILRAKPTDIRDYMEKNPFLSTSPSHPLPSQQ